MAISRSSATRTSQERPARFVAAATLVALLCEPTRSPLRRKQGRNVYWPPPFLDRSVAEPTAQVCLPP
jgi:hypothetical protein